jgi:DNA-binding beta-propeller fold protein YncE
VAGFENGELQRIDLASGRARMLLRTGGAMRHLVGDPQGRRLYADDMGTNQAFVVDLASERVRKLAGTDHVPNTIDLTPDGKVLYVSNRGRNGASYYLPGPEWGSVLAIDAASGKVLDAMVGGNQTTGLDVSADGRLLAFSDFLDNRIHIYAVPPYQALAAGGGGRAAAHRAELAKR